MKVIRIALYFLPILLVACFQGTGFRNSAKESLCNELENDTYRLISKFEQVFLSNDSLFYSHLDQPLSYHKNKSLMFLNDSSFKNIEIVQIFGSIKTESVSLDNIFINSRHVRFKEEVYIPDPTTFFACNKEVMDSGHVAMINVKTGKVYGAKPDTVFLSPSQDTAQINPEKSSDTRLVVPNTDGNGEQIVYYYLNKDESLVFDIVYFKK